MFLKTKLSRCFRKKKNEYTLYEDADNTIPKLLERMLNEVEFENVFYKKTIFG